MTRTTHATRELYLIEALRMFQHKFKEGTFSTCTTHNSCNWWTVCHYRHL